MKILLILTLSCSFVASTFMSGYSKVRMYNSNPVPAPAPVSYIILPPPPIIHTGSALSIPLKNANPPSPISKARVPPNNPVIAPQNSPNFVPHRPVPQTYAANAETEPSKPFSIWSIFQLPKQLTTTKATPTLQTYGAIQSYAEPNAKPFNYNVVFAQRHPPLPAAYYTQVFPSEFANQGQGGLRQVPPPKQLPKQNTTTTTGSKLVTPALPIPTRANPPPQAYSLYLLPIKSHQLNSASSTNVNQDPAANYFNTFESVERASNPSSTPTSVSGTTKCNCEKVDEPVELKIAYPVPVPIARVEESTEETPTTLNVITKNETTSNSTPVIKAEARIMELYSDSKTEQWRPI